MAQEGYGGFAEGLLAGFNTVQRAVQNAQNLKMQKQRLQQEERQADAQLMNYYVNQMAMRGLDDSIKGAAFEGYKGILKKNYKDFGITDPSVIDSYKWDSNNKTLQEAIKDVVFLNKKLDANEITRSQHATSLMGILVKVKDPDEAKILEKAAAASAAENLRVEEREQKKQSTMFTALASQNKIAMTAEGEGTIPGYNATTEGALVETPKTKREEEWGYERRKLELAAELKEKAGPTKSQQLSEVKHLHSMIDKRYGLTELGGGYSTDYKVEEIMQVHKVAEDLYNTGKFTAPEAAILAEKWVMGEMKEKKLTEGIKPPKKGVLGSDWGGNYNETAEKMEMWDGDPVVAVKRLIETKWEKKDLVRVSRNNKAIGTAMGEVEKLAKDSGKKGWVNIDSLPGISFYWDGKAITDMKVK